MKKYLLYSEEVYPAKHFKIHHVGSLYSCFFCFLILKFFYFHTSFKIKPKY